MAALVAVSLSAVPTGSASAQTGSRLGDALLGRQTAAPSAPMVGRYISEQGPSFVLDRSTSTPMLRFENSPEVWVLQTKPGPRGDTFYYNDLGQMVLRTWAVGGVTLYTSSKPDGLAASLSGPAQPIGLSLVLNETVASQRLDLANRRMARAAQRPIKLDLLAKGTLASAVAVDATALIADAFEATATQPGGARILAGIHTVSVRIATSGASVVELQDGVLRVTIRPEQGPAGRPSSRRVLATLAGG